MSSNSGHPTASRRLLVVERDHGLSKHVQMFHRALEFERVSTIRTALSYIRAEEPPVVLLHLGFSTEKTIADGLHLIDKMINFAPTTKIIALADRDRRHCALEALERGAHDFLSLPVDASTLQFTIERAFEHFEWGAEHARQQKCGPVTPHNGLIGESQPMRELYKTLERIAPADIGILLLGESGSGKEVVARAIHALSDRRKGRFVAINCAAIPPSLLEGELFGFEKGAFTGAIKQTRGKIELADGGTLFLDEIGDFPLDLQAKLLRFLQERVIERLGGRREIAVDTRIICATHRDVDQLIEQNLFRSDLYFRLCEIGIELPALRGSKR